MESDTVGSMTTIKSVCTMLACVFSLFSLQARAQESTDDASTGPQLSEGGDMFQLFLTGEQRRLLEAMRQGLLRDDQLDRVREINTARLQKFEELNAEDIKLDEFISFDTPQEIGKDRLIDLRLDGFIRIGDRHSTLLLNGRYIDVENFENLGVDVNALTSDKKSEVMLIDTVREKRVAIKPGQTIPAKSGGAEITENYVSILQEAPVAEEVEAVPEGEAVEIDIADSVAEPVAQE